MSQQKTHLSQRSCRCCCPVSRNGDEKKILVFLLHDDALTCFQILPFSPLSRASSSTLVSQLSGCVLLAAAFIRRGDCLNCERRHAFQKGRECYLIAQQQTASYVAACDYVFKGVLLPHHRDETCLDFYRNKHIIQKCLARSLSYILITMHSIIGSVTTLSPLMSVLVVWLIG